MAPEVLTANYGKECDIWSLGVLLYFLITGNFPFKGSTAMGTIMIAKSGKFEMPATLSDSCAELIKRMLTVNPEKRITGRQALEHPWIKNHVHFSPNDENIPERAKIKGDVLDNLKAYRGRSVLKRKAVNLLATHL